MLGTVATLTAILVLAAVAEALVEHLVKPVVGTVDPPARGIDWRELALRYISALIGVGLCILYRADLLVLLQLHPPWPWIGYIITGLLIGRGSNFVHDFATRWLTPQDN